MVEVLIVFMALLQSHLSLFHLLQNTFCFQGVAKMLQKQFDHLGNVRKPALLLGFSAPHNPF